MVRGIYYLNDSGDKYDGEIKDGKFDGYGKYYWNSGNWFEGIFKDGKPYCGVLVSPCGTMTEIKDGINK